MILWNGIKKLSDVFVVLCRIGPEYWHVCVMNSSTYSLLKKQKNTQEKQLQNMAVSEPNVTVIK